MEIHHVAYNPHHKNYCAHGYKITNFIMKHPDGGCVVMGSDGRAHVAHEDCVKGSGFTVPEIKV